MKISKEVNWHTYAQKYDLLLSYNPFYQQLHAEVMQHLSAWKIQPGDVLADIGAGTGNYSLALAQNFPQATVLHIDRDQGMNSVTAQKSEKLKLENHRVLTMAVKDMDLNPASLKGLISIHALYTFPQPTQVLQKMNQWLQAGGYAVLVNAGRIVNVLDWQLAIGWQLLRRYGLRQSLQILREGKEVSRQNAYIRNMQRKGVFWTHSHEEFCQAVTASGLEILHHQKCFRGISDLVIARKPE